MGVHSRLKFRIIITVIIVFGVSFGINAKFQTNSPGKIMTAQTVGQQQAEGQPAADVLAHWQAFAAQSDEQMAVSWSPKTGTPEAIYGKLSRPMGQAALVSEAAARRFLAENAPLFKMTDLQDLTLVRSFESPMGRHFVFQQDYKGVPVFGSETAVHFNNDAQIVALNNSYLPNINLSVEPTVNREGALELARLQLLRDNIPDAVSELVVYNFDNSFSLAWHITVPTSRRTWELFIDAHTGGVIGSVRDINRYINTGRIFNVNANVATLSNSVRDNNNSATAVPSTAYSTVTLQGLTGNGRLDGLYASSSATKKRVSNSSNDFIFDRSSDGFSETMGYYFVDYAQRYIRTLGFTNINNRQQVFSANGTRQDNSFYSPGTKQLTFGTGGVDDAEDAEVIWHEYGHSIQDNQVPGFGSTAESGAMGEGFGDYWGGTIGAQLSGGFQDTCIAEWDATSYSSANPPCLRRVDGTKHYPENVVGQVSRPSKWSCPYK